MLTKSQRVRQYQDTRVAYMGYGVPSFNKFRPLYPVAPFKKVTKRLPEPDIDLFKYNQNQPRDERGRFASTGGASARARGVSTGNPFLAPSNSPSWWPTMGRDLTAIGFVAGAVGIAPVVALGGRSFARTLLRGLGPVATRIAQRTGGNVVRTFHTLARQLGFKIPRGALRGVPRGPTAAGAAAAAAAWRKMPKGTRKAVDDAVDKITRATRRARTAKPGGPK